MISNRLASVEIARRMKLERLNHEAEILAHVACGWHLVSERHGTRHRRRVSRASLAFALLALSATTVVAQEGNPPPDRPVSIDLALLDSLMAPYVAQARATFPDAKRRFLAGLPQYHAFFATTRLGDSTGRVEQVFVRVARIESSRIYGTIASELLQVREFARGQPYDFPESDLLDWTILRPDGTEEGNFVGKFLDTLQ